MKTLTILVALLAIVGCNNPKDYYQLDELDTFNIYENENKELYAEVWAINSFTWVADIEVAEKEDEIILRVPYTVNDSGAQYVRNKDGNYIQKLNTKAKIEGGRVFYLDDSGLHELEPREWREGLLDPYVVPELVDPFETPRAEPAGTGQPM